MIFKPLTREEYERLTTEQRLDYLQRLQADIAEKMAQTRSQMEKTNKRLDDSGH